MTVRLDGPGLPGSGATAGAPVQTKRGAAQGDALFAAMLAAMMTPSPSGGVPGQAFPSPAQTGDAAPPQVQAVGTALPLQGVTTWVQGAVGQTQGVAGTAAVAGSLGLAGAVPENHGVAGPFPAVLSDAEAAVAPIPESAAGPGGTVPVGAANQADVSAELVADGEGVVLEALREVTPPGRQAEGLPLTDRLRPPAAVGPADRSAAEASHLPDLSIPEVAVATVNSGESGWGQRSVGSSGANLPGQGAELTDAGAVPPVPASPLGAGTAGSGGEGGDLAEADRHPGKEGDGPVETPGAADRVATESLPWTAPVGGSRDGAGSGAGTAGPAPGSAASATLFHTQEPVPADRLMDLLANAAETTPDGEYTVTLRLHPASLGEVRLHLQLAGREVQTLFEVTSPEARQALEQRSDQLRQGLTDAGLSLSGFSVSTGGGERHGWERQETADWLWDALQDRTETPARPGPQPVRRPARATRPGVLDTLA